MDEDKTGPYILHSEVEKAIKEMKGKRATGDDKYPQMYSNCLGEDGLKIQTQLINYTYETGDRPKDCSEVAMTALRRSQKLPYAATIAQSALSCIRQTQQQGY
jgi:hypothetical protein